MFPRLAAILLSAAMLFGIAGYYAVFKLEQYAIRKEIRQEVKSGLPQERLHRIAVAIGTVPEWEEYGREFRYRGDLYDVVQTVTRDDSTIYFCINDKEEAALFAGLSRQVEQRQGSSSGSPFRYLKKMFFSLVYCLPQQINIAIVCTPACIHRSRVLCGQGLLYFPLHSPPPEPSCCI